jgi:excisionase family DNA binding protein
MARMRKGSDSAHQPPPESVNGSVGEVLTLSEAAAYLRLPEADVRRLAKDQQLGGRQIGKEWRFLRTAIQDWLRASPTVLPSKAAQLAAAGSWKDDPYVEEELKEIYRQRGRSMTEDEG